jgi:glycine cleavage system aminomethyltransferase T
VSFAFLSVEATASAGGLVTASLDVVARSPMERQARAAGARFEVRGGWNVAVAYDGEHERLQRSVGWSDASHLTKLELSGPPPLSLGYGTGTRTEDGWWLPMTRTRTLLVDAQNGAAEHLGAAALDVTTAFGALILAGPLARETFARFTALDLRPHVCPPGAWRPGSVARTPGGILCLAEDRFLMLFGAALGQYVWTVVSDAGGHLGGGPVGADALVREEAGAGA